MNENKKNRYERENMKTLLVIDPQVDFISGSMSVPGARKQMEALDEWINMRKEELNEVVVTLDWHPADHISFRHLGGMWPSHCVAFTEGALPFPVLYDTMLRYYSPKIVLKGQDSAVEEYGAFGTYREVEVLQLLLGSDEIYVAGIMSEYCVLESIKGLVEKYPEFCNSLKVMLPFIATLDNHESLKNYCKENNIQTITEP